MDIISIQESSSRTQKWIKDKSKKYNAETEKFAVDSELKKIYEDSFSEATEEIKGGNLSTSQILSSFIEIADEKSKHELSRRFKFKSSIQCCSNCCKKNA